MARTHCLPSSQPERRTEITYGVKLALWVAAVALFVVVGQVARIWVPDYVAQALGFVAMWLPLKFVIETAEHPISWAKWAVAAVVGAGVGMALMLLFDMLFAA